MTSVVRLWLSERCTFKQQTVLLSALRGCDGMPKEDISKKFTRRLRNVLLLAADRSSPDTPGTFMYTAVTDEDIARFTNHLDHYPMHWLIHFTHAVEIVGYKHPFYNARQWWLTLYLAICAGLHLNPETEMSLDERLVDDDPEPATQELNNDQA